jgi:predicted GTPase
LKVAAIAARTGKTSQAVMKKLERLGLKVVDCKKPTSTTTSEMILPKELSTVEEALKIQAGT